MLDMFFVYAPPKPTTSYTVNGTFNQLVQSAFNMLRPTKIPDSLSKAYKIGVPDASTITQLIDDPDKALNPMNHRLRFLSHNPFLGLIFGLWDMMHGAMHHCQCR